MFSMATFQSTRPVKGATSARACSPAPCRVSIHAPREGRDFRWYALGIRQGAFQSTRPVKGATGRASTAAPSHRVSIHAPREGRDLNAAVAAGELPAFQSTRPVKGATHGVPRRQQRPCGFNPRAP